MFEMSLQTVALSIAGPLAVIYMLKHAMSFFHNAKSRVDEFQKQAARASGVARQAQLPMIEEIMVNVAALDADDGLSALKHALDSIDTMPELIRALEANFVWQFDHRGKTEDGVKLIVAACLDNQAIRAGITAGFEAEEEAAATAAALKVAKAAIAPVVTDKL